MPGPVLAKCMNGAFSLLLITSSPIWDIKNDFYIHERRIGGDREHRFEGPDPDSEIHIKLKTNGITGMKVVPTKDGKRVIVLLTRDAKVAFIQVNGAGP